MDTKDPRQDSTVAGATRRRAWIAPQVVDHGSLRWFVRASSGAADDGHTGTGGGGGQMQSKPPM